MRFFTRGLVLLLLLISPSAASAQFGVLNLYEDPNGLFTVPVPAGWSAQTTGQAALLISPEQDISVYVLAVAAPDAQQGLINAWAQVYGGTYLTYLTSDLLPSAQGVEQTIFAVYDTGIGTRRLQGYSQYVGGTAYVIFTDVRNQQSAQRRDTQLQIIASGLTINALDQIDLSSVEPLPLSLIIISELEAYIRENMALLGVPGLSIAIVQNGNIVYSNGFGVRQNGWSEPVTAETMMRVGSVTKSMTTTMMATVVDDRLMAWNTPVVEVLPSFSVADPALTPELTMQNLVCNCTGVPRRDLEWVFNTPSAETVIESLAGIELYSGFGEMFLYSNQMIAAGGYITALAAGGVYGSLFDSYTAAMQTRVFDRVDMESTTFSFADVQATMNFATPHGVDATGQVIPLTQDTENILLPIAPAGAAWSNALDLARYLIMQLGTGTAQDGTQVVSPGNLQVTWQPQIPVTGRSSYGLGWYIEAYKGLPLIYHGGGTFGFTADIAFLPEAGIGIVVLTNQQGSFLPSALRIRLLELLYQQPMEQQANVIYTAANQQRVTVGLLERFGTLIEAEVQPYIGTYSNPLLGEVTLTLRDGVLWFDTGEFRSRIQRLKPPPRGTPDFILYDPPLARQVIDFVSDNVGNQSLIITFGDVDYVFTR